MRFSRRCSTTGRLAPALVALALGVSNAAWAGSGGGADLGSVQQVLNGVCTGLHITKCPQLPTINQVVVEISALTGLTPNVVRTNPRIGVNVPPGAAVDAGTLTGLSNPLAFITTSNGQGQPIPTQPNNPAANSFLSATTTPAAGPTTLDLSFNFLPRTNSTFAPGQDIGDITLPIVVADVNKNLVRDVSARLEIRGAGGTSLTTDIVGDFLGTGTPQTDQLSALGMSFSVIFSPNEIATVGIPLLITSDVAPAYLASVTGSATGFEFDPQDKLFDGINPIASFLNASFLDDLNDLTFAANADLAIARDGRTIISDPVPEAPEPSSLALLGSGLFGLSLLRRRLRARQTDPDAQRTAREP